jgi:superfamily I DNA and/or RNA helicase
LDKFQGQEAPVCLISMATSSADELPRNIEFLSSVNRRNVAISRAQALAVVFASPRLTTAYGGGCRYFQLALDTHPESDLPAALARAFGRFATGDEIGTARWCTGCARSGLTPGH